MSEKIRHSSVVERVARGMLTVRIVQTSACAACGAKGLCHAAERKEMLIDVAVQNADNYAVGQIVEIEGKAAFGMKAVRLAFLYPLLLLLGVMIALMQLTDVREWVCALAALGICGAWYIVLSFFKEKLRTSFSFQVSAEQNMIKSK